MQNAIALTNEYFESSCGKTPQYTTWHRTFKREFSKFLTSSGATNIQIGKPNHFDMSGFSPTMRGKFSTLALVTCAGQKIPCLSALQRITRIILAGLTSL